MENKEDNQNGRVQLITSLIGVAVAIYIIVQLFG